MCEVQGRTGQSVFLQTGLNLGCPVSPTIFGLFVIMQHWFLAARGPDMVPVLSKERRVPDSGYANDFVLLAESAEAFESIVECCEVLGMLISTDKTKLIVLSQVWSGPFQNGCALDSLLSG